MTNDWYLYYCFHSSSSGWTYSYTSPSLSPTLTPHSYSPSAQPYSPYTHHPPKHSSHSPLHSYYHDSGWIHWWNWTDSPCSTGCSRDCSLARSLGFCVSLSSGPSMSWTIFCGRSSGSGRVISSRMNGGRLALSLFTTSDLLESNCMCSRRHWKTCLSPTILRLFPLLWSNLQSFLSNYKLKFNKLSL